MSRNVVVALATLVVLAAPPPAAAQLDTTYGCVVCHADKRAAFVQGVHAERGIGCVECHGGDAAAFALPAAHRGQFVGAPGKLATVGLCGSCHSDPDRMRQFGLPTGQVAEFRTSRHGRLLLLARNQDAPTCTDCHDAHTILRPDDARSTVHPTNISATCARCHEQKPLMAKYGLPTYQVERFRRSAHGAALFQDQNFAAPTCVGCHGSHAALPPTVTEIANVCGRCHVLVAQAFARGPHGPAARAGRLPGCLGCHSNHGTERFPPERIVAVCTKCHAEGTRGNIVATEIQQRVVRATEDLRAAEDAVQRLGRAGRPTGDARFRYQTALTSYLQVAQAQHSLDVEQLDDLGRRVRSVSADIRGAAEAAEERQWEHKLLLVPVWFLALAALVMAWFTLRDVKAEERGA